MALEPGSGRRSVSPESSGRESPIPRQWRNQLGEGMYALLNLCFMIRNADEQRRGLCYQG